jgi:hypothetical protein
MTRVVHCKREPYDVYIGRPSKWGNPLSHLPGKGDVQVATREEAVAGYELWLQERPDLVAAAKVELRGKVLGCWCSPKACHGDVLARVADED